MNFRKYSVFFLIIAILFLHAPKFVFGQIVGGEAAVQNREAQLRAELDQVLKDIAEKEKVLQQERAKGASLERDRKVLELEIASALSKIRAKNLLIETLGKDINLKTQTINELNEKIERSKESLGQLMRRTHQYDGVSLVEAMLENRNLSEFFLDQDSFDSINGGMQELFEEIQIAKNQTEVERTNLDKRKSQETDARRAIEGEKRKIEVAEAEKKRLLNLSKQEQKNYETVIKSREKRAAEIRSALFALRDSAAIPFGKALEYANFASAKTGVRPAYILAILTQETNLGANVGTCNRPQDPLEKHWKAIMPGPGDKSSRDDEAAYLRITSELGLDPNNMPLSCPWQTGWGGAMGPSQFIPTTWELFKDRIKVALGKTSPANPWEPKDAFMATAFYTMDLGAAGGSYSAERDAACRYYSGRKCDSRKPANTFYGNQVMGKAASIQENMIDPLQNL